MLARFWSREATAATTASGFPFTGETNDIGATFAVPRIPNRSGVAVGSDFGGG